MREGGWVQKFLKVYSSILYSPMITVMALRVIEKEEEEKCDEQTDERTNERSDNVTS